MRQQAVLTRHRLKFKQGIQSLAGAKRKRDDGGDDQDDSGSSDDDENDDDVPAKTVDREIKRKKKSYGQKGPNPLSVKKARKTQDQSGPKKSIGEPQPKKRKRKSKAKGAAQDGGESVPSTTVTASTED